MKTKVSVPVAQEEVNFFPISTGHVTTDQFFRPSVPFCMEVLAGSKMEINIGTLRRVDPMPVPPMTVVRFNTRFYYVPFIDICPYYHELKAQTPYAFRYITKGETVTSSVIPTKKPWLISGTLFKLFRNQTTRIEEDRTEYSPGEESLIKYSYDIDLHNMPVKGNDETEEEFINKILNESDIVNGSETNPYVAELVDQIDTYLAEYEDMSDYDRDTSTDYKYTQYEILNDLYNQSINTTSAGEKNSFYIANTKKLVDCGFVFDTSELQPESEMEDFIDGYALSTFSQSKAFEQRMRTCDFMVYSSVISGLNTTLDRVRFYNYTERGRVAYKILKQLGYDYDIFHYGDDSGTEYDAMALLGFLKVMMDFYENSAFINNTERLSKLNSLLHIDSDAYQFTVDDIDLIMDLCLYMTYENDYFTTNMVNPIVGNNSVVNNESIKLQDPTAQIRYLNNKYNAVIGSNIGTNSSGSDTNGTPMLGSHYGSSIFSGDLMAISSTGIKLLQRLTDYLKRHQIAGGRFVDRILAEFGVGVDNDYARRTSYVETVKSVLQINPVMNTTSEQLGDYAGFGWSANKKDPSESDNIININVPKEDGIIIAIDTITPEIFYSQGYSRRNRHIGPFDMYRPEFDGIMPQITEQGEILMAKKALHSYGVSNNAFVAPSDKTFGYTDRYMEYKTMISQVTGDFICESVNLDIVGYVSNRKFEEEDYVNSNNVINITQSRVFSSVYDQRQYNRMFYFDEGVNQKRGKTDYIKSIYRFDIKLWSPMRSPFDNYIFDSGGKYVNMSVNGNTMK